MAEVSYRFNPIFVKGSYWRLDISYRQSSGDDHHFIDDHGSGITNEPAGTYTKYTIPELKFNTRDNAEIIKTSIGKIEIESTAISDAWLTCSNASAEARIFWSNDNVTYVPVFWGIVNLSDWHVPTKKIIGSTYIKAYTVTLYDGIKKLDFSEFRDYTLMSLTGYQAPSPFLPGNSLWIGDKDFIADGVSGYYYDSNGYYTVQNVMPSGGQLTKWTFFLEQLARVAFDEVQHGVYPFKAVYGHDTSAMVDSVMSFIARTDQITSGAYFEKQFDDVYYWHDVFSAEWAAEFKTWGEFLHVLCDLLGFSVTTGYSSMGTGATQGANRYLRYNRIAGDNGSTITPVGALLRRAEVNMRHTHKFVKTSTRWPSGGYKIKDHTAVVEPSGLDVKLRTYWRTLGPVNPTTLGEYYLRSNIMWQTLALQHPTFLNRWYTVTNAKYTKGADTLTAPSMRALTTWGTIPLFNHGGGIARVMSEYYSVSEWKKGNVVLEEEYNDVRADNGVSSTPANWLAYATMSDGEYTGTDFKLTGVTIRPYAGENGRVILTKETE